MKLRLRHLSAPPGLLIAWMVISHSVALAQWTSNTNLNNAVIASTGDQRNQQVLSDGSGGLYVVWCDWRRSFYSDVYIQHFNAAGYSLWAPNGLLISQGTISTENTMSIIEQHPRIISDGGGGVIVTWEDERDTLDGPYSVYAQRIDAAGVIRWAQNGVRISSEPHSKLAPMAIEDGSGGAIVVWSDTRDTVNRPYAQRINANGIIQWSGGDVALSTDMHGEGLGGIVSDGAGGAIVVWTDERSGLNAIYAQRIDPSGSLMWQPDGIPITSDNNWIPVICSDGSGGAIVAWQAVLSGDIFAQRISGAGMLQWPPVLPPIASPFGSFPTITATDGGHAVIAWTDGRNGYNDLYAQMVDPIGTPLWTPGGMPIDTASHNANGSAAPVIVNDGTGGVIITWNSFPNGGNSNLWAQRVTSAGLTLWAVNGVVVSNAAGDQFSPAACSDGDQGVIVAWSDFRTGTNLDIYAQRIDNNGEPGTASPAVIAVRDIANDQGGKMRVLWAPSALDASPKHDIYSYTIKLGVKNSAVIGKRASQGPGAPDPIFWQTVTSVPADWSDGYSAVVPTAADSGLQGIPRYYIQILALSYTGHFWKSNIDSGYSVDNIPPVGIAGASIQSLPGNQVGLQWQKDRLDPDLMGYYVYRGLAPGFALNESSRLTLAFDTTYTDQAVSTNQDYYYRIVGVDIHGNQGSPSTELLKQKVITGVENMVVPKEFAIGQNYPNPFNPSTTIEFTVAELAKTTLKIYDILGKEIAVLFDQQAVPGQLYQVQFHAATLPSGIYVSVLESGGKRLVRRMALVK